jgi:hypothetical protein
MPAFEGRAQGIGVEAEIDGAADRVADDAPGRGVEDNSRAGEAAPDRNVGDADESEMVRSSWVEVACVVWKERAVVPAVGCDGVSAPHPGLQVVLPHPPTDARPLSGCPAC